MNVLNRCLQNVLSVFGYGLVSNRHFRIVSRDGVDRHFACTIRGFATLARQHALPSLPPLTATTENLLGRLEGTTVPQAFLILERLNSVLPLPGEVCEFGCASGATSALLAHTLLSSEKRFWIFDSFRGLPPPTAKDRLLNDIFGLGCMERYRGYMAYPEAEVRRRVAQVAFPVDRLRIVPGFVEETLRGANLPAQVAYAYVDLDLYEPIVTALAFLDHVMVEGGIIVVHDYGFFSSGAKTAVDEFAATAQARYQLQTPAPPFEGVAVLERRGIQPPALAERATPPA